MNREPLPPGVDRWNWGAFLLNWIWGLGNNTLIAMLALVPMVNVVMMFVLGAKGSAWAWRNKRWRDVAHFQRVQRYWAIAGVIAWLAVAGLFALAFSGLVSTLRSSDVYRLTVERVAANEEAVRLLGAPIEGGFPSGSFSVSGASGEADIIVPVQGSIARGTVYVQALREMGVWHFERIELEIEGRQRRIDLQSGHDILPRSPSEKQAAL